MLLNCSIEEDSWESLGLQRDQPVHPKGNQSWLFIGKTYAEYSDWCSNTDALILWPTNIGEQTPWKRPWCWERLKAGGEGDNIGWDDWMASPTRWTWVWTSSGSWWWTGKPGMLQCMESQRVRHDWVAKLNWYLLSQWCHPTISSSVAPFFSSP